MKMSLNPFTAEVHIWTWYSKLYFYEIYDMYVGIDCSNMFSMIIVNFSKVENEISDFNFQNFTFLIKTN